MSLLLISAFLLCPQGTDEAEKRAQQLVELQAQMAAQEKELPKLMHEMKQIVSQGATPEEAVVKLEEKLQTALTAEARVEQRAEMTAALQVLRDETLRKSLVRSSTPITVKIPDWAFRVLEGSTGAATPAGSSQGMQVAFDGAKQQAAASLRPPADPYFKGIVRSPERMSKELHDRINGAIGGPTVVAPSAIENAHRLGREAAGQREELGRLEIEVGRADLEIRTREAAAREIEKEAEALEAPIRPQIAERDKTAKEIQGLMSQITSQRSTFDSVLARWKILEAKVEKIDAEMKPDPTGFYNRNAAQCKVVKEWVEGNTRRFNFMYLPREEMVDEANGLDKRGVAVADEVKRLQARKEALSPTLEKQMAAIREPEAKIRALRAKGAEAKRGIDVLKAKKSEQVTQMESLQKSLTAAAAEIGALVDRMRSRLDLLRQWADAARDAISSLQK